MKKIIIAAAFALTTGIVATNVKADKSVKTTTTLEKNVTATADEKNVTATAD
jgi:hypothetical protein